MFGIRVFTGIVLAATIWLAPIVAQSAAEPARVQLAQSEAEKAKAAADKAAADKAAVDKAAADKAAADKAAAAADKAAAEKAAADKAAADKAAADKAAAEAAKKKKDAADLEAKERDNAAKLQGSFRPSVLAGGTINDFRIDQPANRLSDVKVYVTWVEPDGASLCAKPSNSPDEGTAAGPTSPVKGSEATKTAIGIPIPSPPCWWPLRQDADITIKATVEGATDAKPLFKGRMSVSGLWFPLVMTILVLALIYPGCAAASWYVRTRQYKKNLHDHPDKDHGEAPEFWPSLDPVELTKSPLGRGSIAKLQIFTFSFIVFGLLLFNVLRTGLLANMSTDVLYLMGISAFGAAGGKMAFRATRRLSLDNWAWLRRQGWLGTDKDIDIAPRAKWGELFVDNATKEFDPYRFQMGIFSLVVAIALISVSATGLEAFAIPPEMLGLLGISQVVFVGGQALEDGGYGELDKKLTEAVRLGKSYNQLKAKAAAASVAPAQAAPDGTPPAKTEKGTTPEAELAKYQDAVTQAAEMFASVYNEQIGDDPPEPLTAARNGIVPPP